MVQPLTAVSNLSPGDQIAFSFAGVFGTLRAVTVQQILLAWHSLPDYRDSSVPVFLEQAVPIMQASRETAVTTQAAMIAAQLQVSGVDSNYTVPVADIANELRNGAPLEQIYTRPFEELWRLLGQGKPFDLAVDEASQRARQLVETDIQLSRTHSAKDFFSHEPRVRGFKRVPTGVYTCALCLVASTQRYRSFDLLPIHPGCDCSVAPIISSGDVPQVVDADFLEQIHSAVQSTFGMSARDARQVDYRKILVVHEHGELGPILAKQGNHFTKI